jgi:prephenate dehydrogenase
VTGLRPGDGRPGDDADGTGVARDVEEVPLTGDWPAALLSRCGQGAVVIALTRESALLR